jgi:hypothetical protein
VVVGAGSSSVLLRCSPDGMIAIGKTWCRVVRNTAAVIGSLLVYGGVFNELVSWFNCNNCSTRDAMRSLAKSRSEAEDNLSSDGLSASGAHYLLPVSVERPRLAKVANPHVGLLIGRQATNTVRSRRLECT